MCRLVGVHVRILTPHSVVFIVRAASSAANIHGIKLSIGLHIRHLCQRVASLQVSLPSNNSLRHVRASSFRLYALTQILSIPEVTHERRSLESGVRVPALDSRIEVSPPPSDCLNRLI